MSDPPAAATPAAPAVTRVMGRIQEFDPQAGEHYHLP